ncbi:MAG TPA: hypothetical protein VHS78_05290 [Candidatus Elarobacter sp.]|nr:hypothetical protein [Candidatus Elarobacter sp.]
MPAGTPDSGARSASWVGALRQDPSVVTLSLSHPQMAYLYVDAGATNGVYPSASQFAAEFQAANPGLSTGPCSRVAQMTGSVLEMTDASGVLAPSYVLFFTPLATGTCTQQLALGAEGTRSFTATVSP